MLTLAAALAHLVLRFPPSLFVVDSVGYLLLLAGMYLPLPGMATARPWLRWVLVLYALLNIGAWIVLGSNVKPDRLCGAGDRGGAGGAVVCGEPESAVEGWRAERGVTVADMETGGRHSLPYRKFVRFTALTYPDRGAG